MDFPTHAVLFVVPLDIGNRCLVVKGGDFPGNVPDLGGMDWNAEIVNGDPYKGRAIDNFTCYAAKYSVGPSAASRVSFSRAIFSTTPGRLGFRVRA